MTIECETCVRLAHGAYSAWALKRPKLIVPEVNEHFQFTKKAPQREVRLPKTRVTRRFKAVLGGLGGVSDALAFVFDAKMS